MLFLQGKDDVPLRLGTIFAVGLVEEITKKGGQVYGIY
jgi:hypothetical protein